MLKRYDGVNIPILLGVFLVIKDTSLWKFCNLYCGELPFDLMYDFIKWKFLTLVSLSLMFQLDFMSSMSWTDKVDSYILKYDHFKCSI